ASGRPITCHGRTDHTAAADGQCAVVRTSCAQQLRHSSDSLFNRLVGARQFRPRTLCTARFLFIPHGHYIENNLFRRHTAVVTVRRSCALILALAAAALLPCFAQDHPAAASASSPRGSA